MSQDKGKNENAEENRQEKEQSAAKRSSKDSQSKGKSQALDLDQIKHSNLSQAPKAARASTIAETARNRQQSKTAPPMNWKFSIFACLGSMFLGLCTHIFGINAGLCLYDRYNLLFLMSKELMGKISRDLLADMLGGGTLMQPWLKASFIGDQGEYGLNFVWYHTVQVYWHAISTGLVFVFVLTMARHLRHQNRLKLDPYHLALLSSLIFACHPLSCQAVTYLSARSALLGANNYFLSLCLFLAAALLQHKIARACFALLALITGAMSVWSNPECLTLPLAALLCLLLIKRPLSEWKQTVQEHPFFAGGTAALSILLPCLAFLGFQSTQANCLFLPVLPTAQYLLSQFQGLIFYYIRCFILPLGLSIDPPLVIAKSAADPFALMALAAFAALALLAWSKLKEPLPALACTLIFLGFLPHACMLQRDAVADWVAYLPLAGASIFAAYGLCKLSMHNFFRAAVIASVFLISCFALSIFRDWQWSSNLRLWESALSLRPKSGIAHASLSMELLDRNELDQAENEARLAVSYAPEMVAARLAESKVKLARGKFAEARDGFIGAHNLAEKQSLSSAIKSECKLGMLEALIGLKQEKEANQILLELMGKIADDPRIIYVVGMSAYNSGDYQRAFALLERAVTLNPSLVQCWRPMVESALALGAFEPAYIAARSNLKALDSAGARLLYARVAIVTKREAEAESILKEMLSSDSKNARAAYLLSRLYKRQQKTELWKKYREEASKLDREIAIKFALPEIDLTDSHELNQSNQEKNNKEN